MFDEPIHPPPLPARSVWKAFRGASRFALACAAATLLVGAGRAPRPPALPANLAAARGQDDEERARELLTEAEADVEAGRYRAAARTYTKLAESFPDTEAGRVGALRSKPSAYLGASSVVETGPSSNRVDIAILGDGYTLEHQRAFEALAADVPSFFDQQATFREYASYLNFRRYAVVSEDDSVDGFGREERTALGGRTLGTYAGHVGIDPTLVRDVLAQGPEHDGLAIVYVRTGVLGTGSAGIACVGGRSAETTIHEWGHAFARLGDEYSTNTHERGAVSRRPNVSPTDDPLEVPWAHWIAARVAGVGVYEGASGQVRDAWKPTASGCVMLDGEFFCPPCREALVLRIYSLVDPIERVNYPAIPRTHAATIDVEDSFAFEVDVMQPATHNLEVRWWVLPEHAAPRDPRDIDERYALPGSESLAADRRGRGPLDPIREKPAKYSRANRTGRHEFVVRASELDPGRYRVVCRAIDTTLLRGAKHPWVLKDEFGLLESERAWWIRIPDSR